MAKSMEYLIFSNTELLWWKVVIASLNDTNKDVVKFVDTQSSSKKLDCM